MMKPEDTELRQLRIGVFISFRLVAVVLAITSGLAAAWAVDNVRQASRHSSKAVDDFGRLLGGAIGGMESLFLSIIALICGIACLGCVGWALAMHFRLSSLRKSGR